MEKRYVYGTKTEKWYLVGPEDRDFEFGITQEAFNNLKDKDTLKEVYLGRISGSIKGVL